MLIYYVHVPKKSSLEKSARTGIHVYRENGKKGDAKSPEKTWASGGDEGGAKKNRLSDKVIQYRSGRDENFSAGVGRGYVVEPEKKVD